LFVTVAGEVASADLTPASRRQDHTTSPSAKSAVRQQRRHVHRIPRPTSVTIAKRPSRGGGTAADIDLISGKRERKYFFEKGWTGKSPDSPSGKSIN